jgi:DNA-binding MurR/RpiR family transcriptional regulator
LREVYEPAPEENTPAAVFLRSLIEDHNSLEHTILHLQATDVEAIVGILQTAPRIFIAAEGTAVFPAEMFAMRLYVMGLNAFLVPGDLVARTAMLAGLQRDDAFVGLGMVRLTPGVSTALALAQEQGAQTIGIVALPSNPVASAADYVIQAPAWTTGLMPSMTAVTAVLGALVQALSIQMGDRTAEWALRFEQDYSRLALGLKEAMASLPETLTEINPAQERKRTAKTTEEAS